MGRRALPDGHELSGSLPAHPHLPDVRAVGSGGRGPRAAAAAHRRVASARYRDDYAAYYTSCAEPASPALRDSNPSVVVIPALGVFGFGKDKREARITTEFFVNAIHVMAGANALEDERRPRARRCRRRGGRSRRRRSRASTTTSRCRAARRSGSSTGRSRRRSCSGCRRSASSAGRSRWSSAAAAGSAARSRCSSPARRARRRGRPERRQRGGDLARRRGGRRSPEMGIVRRARSDVARDDRRRRCARPSWRSAASTS